MISRRSKGRLFNIFLLFMCVYTFNMLWRGGSEEESESQIEIGEEHEKKVLEESQEIQDEDSAVNVERNVPAIDPLIMPHNQEIIQPNPVVKFEPPIIDNIKVNPINEEGQKDEMSEKEKEEKNAKANEKKEEEDKEAGLVLAPPKNPDGPGEMGKPFKVDKNKVDSETKKRIERGWLNNAYNEYVSDLISVHRSLPDLRDEWCKRPDRLLPEPQLKQTSVIICFHNEGWSVLLRSVHSVLNRSPDELLEEIILVDDASYMNHLKADLEDYMSQYPKVKIVRSAERVGLIRARLLGASKATAPVLTFLDSHIECTPGWLEPLLDRVARDPTNVVCPVIDVLDTETLAYQGNGYFAVGGFDWNLQFNWHAVPAHENKRREHSWAPAHSPTMAGGLFSIDKQYFEKLGTYDSGFDIWGAENLELSFKTWMCGGTLEIVPCSHVGHIFRKRSPYKWGSSGNVVQRNSLRLAEVWLDDYKKYYYQRIGKNVGEYGDISSRKELRKSLKCHSFKWYLDTIFPELFIPGDSAAQGEIRNLWSKICIDTANLPGDLHKPVGLWPCHNQGGHQYFLMSKMGEIRRDESCLDYGGTEVILYPCHGSRGNQWWQFKEDSKALKHVITRKCLAMSQNKQKLVMEECTGGERQKWSLENFNASLLQK